MKFHVLREHFGDKMYRTGDTREVDERDVKHLIKNGVLSKEQPKAKPAAKKAEAAAPANKAEGAAPSNKDE